MNNNFVDYETASSLKELGFDKKCLASYYTHEIENFKKGKYDYRGKFIIDANDKNDYIINTNSTYYVAAPLYSQVFKWFREKYGYYYQIGNSGDNTKFFILTDSEMNLVWNDKGFKTYELAELTCLKKLIEIVKDKL